VDLYVLPRGNDGWSGVLLEPNATGNDGPLATITCAKEIAGELKNSGWFSTKT